MQLSFPLGFMDAFSASSVVYVEEVLVQYFWVNTSMQSEQALAAIPDELV